MTAESVWEELWDRLNDFYAVLVSHLRARNERLWSQVAHQETAAFPFTGYVSLSKDGPPGDEDLVLAWSVQRRGGHLVAAADISRGDGTVLAELPAADLAEPVDPPGITEEQERAIRFFRSHLAMIEREVC